MHHDSERSLVACSLWLHVGLIGASASAAGLLWLLGGEAGWLSALALAISGGMLAVASRRRARTASAMQNGRRPAPALHPASGPRDPLQGKPGARRMPCLVIPLQAGQSADDNHRHPTPE